MSSVAINNDFKLAAEAHAEYLQVLLNSHSNIKENKLDDLVWEFTGVTVDFRTLQNIESSFPQWAKSIDTDLIQAAKLLFLKSVEGIRSTVLIRYRFDSIVKTFSFLAKKNISLISQTDLKEYYEHMLMSSIHNNRIEVRLTPLSYKNASAGISNAEWVNISKSFCLPSFGFKTIYSSSAHKRALENAIKTLSADDLTFRDWIEGGSFNHLTLDYGRYYAEHCVSFFDDNIALATAIRRTLSDAARIVEDAGHSVNNKSLKSSVMLIIGNYLTGKCTGDLKKSSRHKFSPSWLASLETSTIERFKRNLRTYRTLDVLTSTVEIQNLAQQLRISNLEDYTFQQLKYLVQARWAQLSLENFPGIVDLRTAEALCLKKFTGDAIDTVELNRLTDQKYLSLINDLDVTLPDVQFFKSCGIQEKSSQSTYINNFLRLVEAAGVIKFISLSGWRESEFGFSIKDFSASANSDVLDQAENPVKFQVKWVVPKTSGEAKLNRDITRTLCETAIWLTQLTEADNSSPCLYSFNSLSKDPSKSSEFIKKSVGKLWFHFCNYYKPFVQLRHLYELKELQKSAKHSPQLQARLAELESLCVTENWEALKSDPLLLTAYNRINNEIDRVSFLLDEDLRRGFVWQYKIGALSSEHKNILDQYLSAETKDAILALRSKDQVTPIFTREVINEIISNCLYPTPHAFRHMWAEAVYRRFDGDAGWMIRSNFKHVSHSMWLAYIRNKDNRRQHDKVKRTVVSSMLNNFILKNGEGYAGATEKLVRRMFLNTQVRTLNELSAAIDEYVDLEIEDIKSNPWGFCILRKRSKVHAQCSDGGGPQRQNASPSLCLGCTHNFSQSGNIEGILLGISNDLKVIKNADIPRSFRLASSNTVSIALKQLIKLGADTAIVLEIQNIVLSSQRLV